MLCEDACRDLDGRHCCGNRVRVELSNPRGPRGGSGGGDSLRRSPPRGRHGRSSSPRGGGRRRSRSRSKSPLGGGGRSPRARSPLPERRISRSPIARERSLHDRSPRGSPPRRFVDRDRDIELRRDRERSL